jgi:parallel beta-helix repeat protein
MPTYREILGMPSRIALCLLCAWLWLAGGQSASAATYYVAKTGSNSNSCSQAQDPTTPKLTIHGALACIGAGESVGAGHTVIVKAGTYNEEFSYDLPGGTDWANVFTLKANPGDTVTIMPTAGLCSTKPCRVFTIANAQYIVIEGFVLDASYVLYDAVKFECGTTCGYYIRFLNDEVFNPMANCFLGGSYNQFIGLKVHVCGARDVTYGPRHNSFYLTGDYNLVEKSTVYDCTNCRGILAWDQYGDPSGNVFRNNVVYNTITGIGLYMGTGNIAYNNVVYNNNGAGIVVNNSCKDCQVLNNTSFGNMGEYGSGIGVDASSTGAIVKNNIAWGNAMTDIDWYSPAGGVLSNNLCARGSGCTVTQDPKFVDPLNKNFRLQSGSPAIDTGTNTGPTVQTDILGTPRPQGAGDDIGAYEFMTASATSGTSSTPTSSTPTPTSTSTSTTTSTHTPPSSGFTETMADGTGVLWGFKSDGTIWRQLSGTWTQEPTGSGCATDILGVLSNGWIVVLGCDSPAKAYTWAGLGWVQTTWPQTTTTSSSKTRNFRKH